MVEDDRSDVRTLETALPGAMEQIGGGQWRLADNPARLPHSYTMQAVKRS